MKKILLLAISVISWISISAQVYQVTSAYDTITKNLDTLYYSIPITASGWGDAEISVLFDGDFGDYDEYISVYSPNWDYLGQTSQNPIGDCLPDSTNIYIPTDSLYSWESGGYVDFYLVTSTEVDYSCTNNHAQIRLSYSYCSFGTPVAYASLTIPQMVFCRFDQPVNMTGTPAGGTFSGPGVSGNNFSSHGLPEGNYYITYTATDGIGCVTFDRDTIHVLPTPNPIDTFICPGTSVMLHLNPTAPCTWSDNPGLINPLDTTPVFTTPILYQPTKYFVQRFSTTDYFMVTSFADTSATIIDFDALIGDDRSGIAITTDHVYFIGDDYTGRFSHDLTNGTSFPVHDGIFSDLKTGKLYSLWDGTVIMDYNSSPYFATGFAELDSNMNVIDTLLLSETIELGTNNASTGIYSGYGFTIFYSGNTQHFYVINNNNGIVEDLGFDNDIYPYYSENWANWGVAEFDGLDYNVLFRDGNTYDILRKNLATGNESVAFSASDLGDCATIGYSPWEERWYFHYEGSGQFGGLSETGGYLNATDSISLNTGAGAGCYTEATIMMSVLDLGPNDTTICINENAALFAGTGFASYTWNGINNNWNVLIVDTAGYYEVEVEDYLGCILSDNITVIVDSCTGIDDPEASLINIYPNPANDIVNIEIPTGVMDGNTIITIADARGRIVLEELINTTNGHLYQLDIQALEIGMYQLIITSETQQFAYRLIRQ